MPQKLDVGGVIRRVFNIYVDQASVLMPAAAVVFVVTGILSVLLVAASPGLAIVALLLSLVATTLFTGMVVELVSDIQDGRRDSSAGQLVRAASPVLGKLILIGLVAGVGIVIGLILFIVPGLILITIWAVAAPIVVLERPNGLGALGRSRDLVRGNGWQVFAVLLVLLILVGVVSAIIEAVADSAGTAVGLVVRVIVGVLTAPFSALAASVLYFDLLAIGGGRPADVAAGAVGGTGGFGDPAPGGPPPVPPTPGPGVPPAPPSPSPGPEGSPPPSPGSPPGTPPVPEPGPPPPAPPGPGPDPTPPPQSPSPGPAGPGTTS